MPTVLPGRPEPCPACRHVEQKDVLCPSWFWVAWRSPAPCSWVWGIAALAPGVGSAVGTQAELTNPGWGVNPLALLCPRGIGYKGRVLGAWGRSGPHSPVWWQSRAAGRSRGVAVSLGGWLAWCLGAADTARGISTGFGAPACRVPFRWNSSSSQTGIPALRLAGLGIGQPCVMSVVPVPLLPGGVSVCRAPG